MRVSKRRITCADAESLRAMLTGTVMIPFGVESPIDVAAASIKNEASIMTITTSLQSVVVCLPAIGPQSVLPLSLQTYKGHLPPTLLPRCRRPLHCLGKNVVAPCRGGACAPEFIANCLRTQTVASIIRRTTMLTPQQSCADPFLLEPSLTELRCPRSSLARV